MMWKNLLQNKFQILSGFLKTSRYIQDRVLVQGHELDGGRVCNRLDGAQTSWTSRMPRGIRHWMPSESTNFQIIFSRWNTSVLYHPSIRECFESATHQNASPGKPSGWDDSVFYLEHNVAHSTPWTKCWPCTQSWARKTLVNKTLWVESNLRS